MAHSKILFFLVQDDCNLKRAQKTINVHTFQGLGCRDM